MDRRENAMSVLSIMDASGHVELEYAPTDTKSVERARTKLSELFGQGWTAVVTAEPGAPGTIIRKAEDFKPLENEEIVVFPQIQGG